MFLTKASSLFQHQNQTIHTGVKFFLEFKRQMLPKYHFGAWQDKTVPIFRVKSYWEPTEYIFPPLQKYFRHVLKDITDLYQQPTTNKVNLSQDEIKALRELNRWRILSSNLQIRVVQSWKTMEHITEEQSLQNLWPKQPILALRQNKNLHDQLVHTNFKCTANNLSETHQ